MGYFSETERKKLEQDVTRLCKSGRCKGVTGEHTARIQGFGRGSRETVQLRDGVLRYAGIDLIRQ